MVSVDHDEQEMTPLPFLLWLILLFQARSWLLFIMAGVSRQQGDTLLRLFEPDISTFYLGLGIGTPALACLIGSGYRHRFPRCWRWSRYGLLISGALFCLVQVSQWNRVALEASPILLILTIFDFLTEWALLMIPRLRHCFSQ